MSINDLVLHHYPLSRSVRVLWLLHELGKGRVQFGVKRVELLAGEAQSPAFVAKNPNHAVPVVEFTDSAGKPCVMFESCGIVQFLADALGPGVLAPRVGPTAERAEFEKWVWFAGSWMDQLLWQLRQHAPGGILPKEERDERTVARTKAKWEEEIEPQVVKQLQAVGNAGYIFGSEFSAADCVVGHTLRWSTSYGLSGRREIQDYLERCSARPAFQAAYVDADTFGAKM